VSLLDELVRLQMDGKLKGTGLESKLVAEQISAGMVTSLKEVGGISRGEDLDKKGPKRPEDGSGKYEKKEKQGNAGDRARLVHGGTC
jgi:hypothetical protein